MDTLIDKIHQATSAIVAKTGQLYKAINKFGPGTDSIILDGYELDDDMKPILTKPFCFVYTEEPGLCAKIRETVDQEFKDYGANRLSQNAVTSIQGGNLLTFEPVPGGWLEATTKGN